MAEQAADEHEWYMVTLSVPWLVRGIDPAEGDSHQDAINIAISQVDEQTSEAATGRRALTVQPLLCPDPDCDHELQAVMGTAGLVLVLLAMDVEVEAGSRDDAAQRATREIGQCLDDTPLRVAGVAGIENPHAG